MKAKPTKSKQDAKPKTSKSAKSASAAAPKKAASASRSDARPEKPRPTPVPAAPAPAAAAAPATASSRALRETSREPEEDTPQSRATRAVRRKEMERFRTLLLEKQRELTDAYKTTKGESREQPGDGTEDYIDYAVSSYAKEFLLSLTELDRKQLIQVEEALRRIDRGEYGRCLQCGEPINPKRLEVQPWARHCVRCQELEEQGLLPQYSYAAEEASDEDEEGPAAVADLPDEDVEREDEDEDDEDEGFEEEPIVIDQDEEE